MRIRIIAKLDPNVTEHEAMESLAEAQVAVAGVMDVVSVDAKLEMTDLPADESDDEEDLEEFDEDEEGEFEDDDLEDDDDSRSTKKGS
jgi:hypothetical protein